MNARTLPLIGSFVIFSLFGVLLYLVFSGETSPETPSTELVAEVSSALENAPLEIDILTGGSGPQVDSGDFVSVYYTGMLEDGTIFDSRTSGEPLSFILGSGEVIDGWELGVVGMTIGEKRRLLMPPLLAYGEAGIPGVIPPNASLVFDIELVGVGPR